MKNNCEGDIRAMVTTQARESELLVVGGDSHMLKIIRTTTFEELATYDLGESIYDIAIIENYLFQELVIIVYTEN